MLVMALNYLYNDCSFVPLGLSSVPRSRPGDCARLATGAGPTGWRLVFQALPGTFQRARS